MYLLERYSLKPVLETVLGVVLQKSPPTLYINDDLKIYVQGLGADHAYIASELGAEGICLEEKTAESQEAVAYVLARPWRVFTRCEPSGRAVYSTVVLPLYFGPARAGLQWARVAASTAVLYHIFRPNSGDISLTLALLKKTAGRMAELVDQNRELYAMYDLAYAAWTTDACKFYGDLGDGAARLGELCDFCYTGGDRCLQFLLMPYNPQTELGKALMELGRSGGAVAVTATESFSPATLYHLRHAERICVLYTPNVYKQVKYAIDVAAELMPDLRDKVKRILISSYNPHINYKVLRHKLRVEGCCLWHPKLSGPMPVYLALKKLEVEGILRSVNPMA
ncbi:MAG: hypothetical protein QXP31_07940 [Pyrobaculum sp.]